MADATCQPYDLQPVEQPGTARGGNEWHLVGVDHLVAGDRQVADRGMNVERIDGGPARRVHGVKELRELHEIARILERARTPSTLEVGTVGRPAHRREGDPLATHPDVVRGVSCMEREFGRWRLQRLLDDVAPDPDATSSRRR
jgi:hypothetical protein